MGELHGGWVGGVSRDGCKSRFVGCVKELGGGVMGGMSEDE